MIQNVLRHMGGIEHYGLISLILFFICFFGMILWACFLRKSFLKTMARLPLQEDTSNSTKESNDHE